MPPHFRFILQPAQGHAAILAPQCLSDGLPEGCLSDTGRSIKTEDRSFHVVLELKHGKVLDDPLFHLLKTMMVAIEDLPGLFEVETVLGELPPGQFDEGLQVIELDGILGSRRIHPA